MKHIGYSELTGKYYRLPANKKESKVDITDDIKEIIEFENSKIRKANRMDFCDAAAHYGASPLPDGICPKCGKKINYYENFSELEEMLSNMESHFDVDREDFKNSNKIR